MKNTEDELLKTSWKTLTLPGIILGGAFLSVTLSHCGKGLMTDSADDWPQILPSQIPDPCIGKEDRVFADGDGSATNPFWICTPDQLKNIQAPNLTKHFVLKRNLNISSMQWTPIGSSTTPFAGSFDGQGHTIDGLTMSGASYSASGLFGYVRADAQHPAPTIHHLQLTQVVITGVSTDVGALVGRNENGIIHHCESHGVISGTGNVGGLIGYSTSGVSQSGSKASVSGAGSCIGGLIGNLAQPYGPTNNIVLNELYATGSVTPNDAGYAGGLMGCVYPQMGGITVTNTYAQGDVSCSTVSCGGLIGYIGANDVTISNSYASGRLLSGTTRGGLVGSCMGSYSNCCFDSSRAGVGVYGCYNNATLPGITAAGTGVMTLQALPHPYSSWDTTHIWSIEAGRYPLLRGQPFHYNHN